MPAGGAEVLPQVGALVEGPRRTRHLSGRANLALFDAMGRARRPGSRRRRVDDALDQVGLGGVDGRPVRAYSLGMRQRLGLAHALLRPAAAAGPRRADERPRPAGHPRDPRRCCWSCNAAGDDGLPVQPPARRGRADVHPGRRAATAGRLVLQDQLDVLQRPTGRVRRCAPRTRPRRAALLDGQVEHHDGDRLLVRTDDAGRPQRPAGAAPASAWTSSTPERRTLEEVVLDGDAGHAARTGGRAVIAVELRKLLRSRRTWVTILLIDALPTLVAVLLAVTDIGPRPGTGPAFLSAVLTDGTLFPLAALAIVLPLFLPIAVAVHRRRRDRGRGPAGHPALPAGPAGRPHPAAGRQAGQRDGVRGPHRRWWSPSRRTSPAPCCSGSEVRPAGTTSVSGTTLSTQELIVRTLLALGYAMFCMLGVAAIALFLSTVVESPLGGGARHAGGADRLHAAAHPGRGRRAAAVPADPLLAGLRRPLPRPDPLARRRPRRRCSRRRTSWSSWPPAGPTSRPRTSRTSRADLARPGHGGLRRAPGQLVGGAIAITAGVRGTSPWVTTVAGAHRLHREVDAPSRSRGRWRHHGLVVGRPDRHPQRARRASRRRRSARGAGRCPGPAAGTPPGTVRCEAGGEPGQVGAVVRGAEGDDAAGQRSAAELGARARHDPAGGVADHVDRRRRPAALGRGLGERLGLLVAGHRCVTGRVDDRRRPSLVRSAAASTSSAVVPPYPGTSSTGPGSSWARDGPPRRGGPHRGTDPAPRAARAWRPPARSADGRGPGRAARLDPGTDILTRCGLGCWRRWCSSWRGVRRSRRSRCRSRAARPCCSPVAGA